MESAEKISPIEKHDLDLAEHIKHASLSKAQLVGAASGLASALAWGLITYLFHFVLGYFAIGVGVFVGWAVKRFGKGSGNLYGTVAGFYALLGCVLGNLFCIAFFVADQEQLPIYKILFLVDYSDLFKAYIADFDFIDLVFYAIAVSSAYKIAANPMKKDELDYVLEAKTAAAETADSGVSAGDKTTARKQD